MSPRTRPTIGPRATRGFAALLRRLLVAVLPDDDWSTEFVDELDADRRRRSARLGSEWRATLRYAAEVLSPRTLRFARRVRRRARRGRLSSRWRSPFADLHRDVAQGGALARAGAACRAFRRADAG